MNGRRRGWADCRQLLMLALLLVCAGCATPVSYTPQTSLVSQQGLEVTQDMLSEVMNRAAAPRVTEVEFIKGGVVYTYMNPVVAWGLAPPEARFSLHYNNLDRLDLYENDKVFLIGPQDRELTSIQFSNKEDATGFVDLLLSLKASHSSE